MVGWHHRLNGHECEQTPGDGDGQGGLECYSPRGHKELDMTERLNWTGRVLSTSYGGGKGWPLVKGRSVYNSRKHRGMKPPDRAQDLRGAMGCAGHTRLCVRLRTQHFLGALACHVEDP